MNSARQKSLSVRRTKNGIPPPTSTPALITATSVILSGWLTKRPRLSHLVRRPHQLIPDGILYECHGRTAVRRRHEHVSLLPSHVQRTEHTQTPYLPSRSGTDSRHQL